ncbi:hypothetical protein FDB37_16270 [Clostridium botulinum]|nr:hypothetical protein [Clostridium botulinum]NFO48398.1 hypothetical protein [Clostridium botulinum]
MDVKQRIVCPACGEGFIVNPKPPEEYYHMVWDINPIRLPISTQPHCDNCNVNYNISINTQTLEISISSIKK